MGIFTHIPSISLYNNNYYNGFGSDLLFESSNDESPQSNWYLVKNNNFHFIGYQIDGFDFVRTANEPT
ncbi:MAG: hypothetical protein ACXAAH_06600 [Promethearchaeota archaeon]